MKVNRRVKVFFSTLLVCGIFFSANAQQKYEMRAVWIATVNNIDWPPQNEFEPYRQREALITMLDTFKNLNINAIIVQIRPTADAFYQSNFEQWSRFLTGEQGVEPYPYYDPLQFIIEQAHERNIEVHAWLNPYRLLNSDDLNLLHQNNIFFKYPELFFKYGNQYFFNPAKDATVEYLKNIVADIVSRYDIDALHIDDYFYPYPIKGKDILDEEDFTANSRGFTDRNDWRRDNVNRAINAIYTTIKSIKPYVAFGVSPFGVWRNKNKDINGSNTKALSNYDDLYADILKWEREGKVDYIIPQLYWEIGHKSADYKELAEWWSKNSRGVNLYVGLYASNLGNKQASKSWTSGNELVREMKLNKQYPEIQGVGLYSAIAIMENRGGIADSLRNSFFRYPALVPKWKNTGTELPAEPQNLRIESDKNEQTAFLRWEKNTQEENLKYYVVYYSDADDKIDINNPKYILATTRDDCLDITKLIFDNSEKKYNFAVSSVSLYNVESKPVWAIYDNKNL